MRHTSRIGIIVFAMVTAIATACTTAPLRIEGSSSEIRAAEEAGAAKVPKASLYLQLAKEEQERANGLAAKGEKEKAMSMLSRSNADADLAVALSREDAERSEERAAVERVRQLRQDNP